MIIYFSGTGNNLSLARDLAHELGEEAVHLSQAKGMQEIRDSVVGFVFPTYYGSIPKYVQAVLREINVSKDSYIFAVIGHGGDPGNSLFVTKKLLETRGLKLSFGTEITMPVNSRVVYGRVATDIEERTRKQKDLVKEIAGNVKGGVDNSETIKEHRLSTWLYPLSESKLAKKFMRKTVDHDKCTRCETCVRVCPLNNIKLEEEGIVIGDNCTECLACVHWCPNAAIGFRDKNIKKKQQYHHPEVGLNDIIKK